MGANGVGVRVSKRFLYQGFDLRSINAYLVSIPCLPYRIPLSIPYKIKIPYAGLSFYFLF